MELLPSRQDLERDAVEFQLAEAQRKREINRRESNGITVIAYWIVEHNVCTIYVHDERTNSACEFEVPNDKVMDNFHHPYANKDAQIPKYEQRLNHE